MISAVLEQVLELTDATLHVALLVLGGVVVAVLAQVAHEPRGLDLVGHFDASAGGEVVEFGLESFVGRPGELGSCHRPRKPTEACRKELTGRVMLVNRAADLLLQSEADTSPCRAPSAATIGCDRRRSHPARADLRADRRGPALRRRPPCGRTVPSHRGRTRGAGRAGPRRPVVAADRRLGRSVRTGSRDAAGPAASPRRGPRRGAAR